jgi:hypothetical protein
MEVFNIEKLIIFNILLEKLLYLLEDIEKLIIFNILLEKLLYLLEGTIILKSVDICLSFRRHN